jgi:methylmalonyl-CoA mutase
VLGRGAKDLTREALDERFVRQLVTTTYDGIAVQPLYTAADRPGGPELIGYPGFAPFVRARSLLGGARSGWDVRQPVEIGPGVPTASSPALDQLERGASSLLLRSAEPIGPGGLDLGRLDVTLEGVYLELITVALDTGLDPRGRGGAARALLDLWARRQVDPGEARGVLGLDPIGAYASEGHGDPAADTRALHELIVLCADRHPHVCSLVVDATRYHEAGASDVEELGCAVATGVAYLRLLTEAGLGIAQALGQLEFRLAATADQFLTIAKLRAARRLWARVAEELGASSAGGQRQHAVTSSAMLTRYDPWVNLLRNTVACFAAGVGGADALTVEPHDVLLDPAGASELGDRMARNTQIVLAEESHLARVIDPAGGSWYVESLTDAVAQGAWRWFQDIEGAGGMVAALEHRLVQDRIEATWERRLTRLSRRQDTITGVSDFPNPDDRTTDETVRAAASNGGLPRRRYAEAFEALRSRTDAHERRYGTRPVVALVQLGSPGDVTARVTFAKSFFETAGLRVVPLDVPDPIASLPALVEETGAQLACLCSSDTVYAEQGAAVLEVLGQSTLARRYVAGQPRAIIGELESAGADEFIYVGCDVLDVLGRALTTLGIE